MPFLSDLHFMLLVARRELTSVFRGKSERILFLWMSMFLLPVLTVGLLTVFLVIRTTDILSPVRIAIAQSQTNTPAVRGLADAIRGYPEIVVSVTPDPPALLAQHGCDATLIDDGKGNLTIDSRDAGIQRLLLRVVNAARGQAFIKFVHQSDFDTHMPYRVYSESIEQYISQSDWLRQGVIALFVVGYLYAVVWLIPAIDVARSDFLQNNLYANLCLPVPMRIIAGGKLLCGLVVTLVPTVLFAIAFIFSMLLLSVVFLDYYNGGIMGGAMSMVDFELPAFQVPLLEILLCPLVIFFSIAFLHSWLMFVIVLLQGQRLSFMISIVSLFMWAQLGIVFGAVAPTRELWPDFVPFFGLAAVMHQLLDQRFSLLGLCAALVSTFVGICFFVSLTGRFYRLEPWPLRRVAQR